MTKKRRICGNWREPFQDIFAEFPESGATLRGLRAREGWTQAKLAKKLHLDQSNISKMERGGRPIGKAMAKRLAKIFNIDYHALL